MTFPNPRATPQIPAHLVQLLTANIPAPPPSYWPTDRDPARCTELWTAYLTGMAADIWHQAWQQAFTAGAAHGMSISTATLRIDLADHGVQVDWEGSASGHLTFKPIT